jgi:hypothetical protein
MCHCCCLIAASWLPLQERLARLEAAEKAKEERLRRQQEQQQQQRAAAAAGPSSMQAQVVSTGAVQGVIRRGKWSQKNQ